MIAALALAALSTETVGHGGIGEPPPAIRLHRFDEDWRGYCERGAHSLPEYDAKCVDLGEEVLLTLGGDLRLRGETTRNPGFGLGQDEDAVLLVRTLVHADLSVSNRVRAFVQLGSFTYVGRDGPATPLDLNPLDVTQAFVDVRASTSAGTQATVRLGRQEFSLGSSRLVSVREGPNVRRSFDGMRAFVASERYRADLFYVRPVEVAPEAFDDEGSDTEAFWGSYISGGSPGSARADAYLFMLERDRARFRSETARERRWTAGLRLWGQAGGWDWDWEAAYQGGSFGAHRIAAWGVATDTGFTLRDLAWTPRFGLRANVVSGDRDPGDRRLNTFNALYPMLAYFSEASLLAPANVADLHPSLTLRPTPRLEANVGLNLLWKATTADVVYGTPFVPLLGTELGTGRYIGGQAVVGLTWRPRRGLVLSAGYVRFEPGNLLTQTGARAVDFASATAAIHF